MSKTIKFGTLFMAALCASAAQAATLTYNYTGNEFTVAVSPQTTTNFGFRLFHLTGRIRPTTSSTRRSHRPPNSFSDGLQTMTNATARSSFSISPPAGADRSRVGTFTSTRLASSQRHHLHQQHLRRWHSLRSLRLCFQRQQRRVGRGHKTTPGLDARAIHGRPYVVGDSGWSISLPEKACSIPGCGRICIAGARHQLGFARLAANKAAAFIALLLLPRVLSGHTWLIGVAAGVGWALLYAGYATL